MATKLYDPPSVTVRVHAGWSRLWQRATRTVSLAYLHDIVFAAVSLIVAAYLRLGAEGAAAAAPIVSEAALAVAAIAAIVFAVLGPYRSLWVYVSLRDALTIARVVTVTILALSVLRIGLPGLRGLPVETLAIAWFVMAAMLVGPRVMYRVIAAQIAAPAAGAEAGKIPLLLVGAGDGTELFLRALGRDRHARYRIVGIVDEMGAYLRRRIHGVEVLGSLDDIARVVAELDAAGDRPERLVITEDNLSPIAVRALLDEAESLRLVLSRIPRLTELSTELGDQVEVRPVAIEDLLGRPQTHLDRSAMARLCQGARILVTGAGGTIGGELVRQISDFTPARLAMLDNSELGLYQIDMELTARHPELDRRPIIGDLRDHERINEVIRSERPDLVFHAGAMKHVPIVEMHPCEGVLTNVLGTRNVADACRDAGVKAMVLISTDKAVNPTNVMGATKRVAESYCQALDILGARAAGHRTRFLTVRFGNVLGSTGSVVPLFQKQLAAGGPLTVTHPHVTRFFMTTREAVELVLEASAVGVQGSGGEGTIFVLDMGEPVRIQDLARQMIRLAGLRPGHDIDIVFTGLRPGEKLFEEVLHSAERLTPTEVRGVLLAAPRISDYALLRRTLEELIETARAKDSARTLALIEMLVPEYQPPSPDEAKLPPRGATVAPFPPERAEPASLGAAEPQKAAAGFASRAAAHLSLP